MILLLPFIAICCFDISGAKWYRLRQALGAASSTTNNSRQPRYQPTSISSATITIVDASQPGNEPMRVKLSHTKRRMVMATQAKEAYAKSWHKQFNLLFCCLGSERRAQQATFLEVASVFSDLFGDSDLVVSDLIAGLILLRHAQKRAIKQNDNNSVKMLSGVPVEFSCHDMDEEHQRVDHRASMKSRVLLNPLLVQKDADLIVTIHYMFSFALASTGWPFYVLRHPEFLLKQPFRKESCCCARPESQFVNDNSCKMNMQAMLIQAKVPKEDVIFADFESGIGETAFIVLLDPKINSVVVSIRGTLSFADILTDLNADSAPIPLGFVISNDSDEWVAHKGMLNAAVSLHERLKKERLLEKAFNTAKDRYSEKDFKLCLVGHSLGAGVATLLGIILKNQYPSLRVFAYSPPGGLVGKGAARYTRSFVTSVILGKDVVPRIGLRQIEALRADIVNTLNASKRKKWNVIGQAALCCGGKDYDLDDPVDFTQIKTMRKSVAIHNDIDESEEVGNENEEESVRGGDESGNISRSSSYMAKQGQQSLLAESLSRSHSNSQFRDHDHINKAIGVRSHYKTLQLPGAIYHIVRQWSEEENAVRLRLVRTCHSVYDHVLVSPRMLKDHMPNGFMDALNQLLDQHDLHQTEIPPIHCNPISIV